MNKRESWPRDDDGFIYDNLRGTYQKAGLIEILVVALVLVVAARCEKAPRARTPDADGIHLFGTLSSQDSPAAVRQKLRAREWHVLDTQQFHAGVNRHYRIDGVAAGAAVHEGFSGEVRLEFHNDKLAKVWFSPENAVGYFHRASIAWPVIDDDPRGKLEGDRLTQTGVAADGRPYIFWLDYRFVLEHSRFVQDGQSVISGIFARLCE